MTYYVAALGVALVVLALAVALILVQRRLSDRQRLLTVLVVFLAGVTTNVLLSAASPASFNVSLQQTLDWTYSALTMFAGAGSVEIIDDLATPTGLPVSWLQVLHYFLQVFAFLFTVSAVVAAIARGQVDRLLLAARRFEDVFEVHGFSPEAVALAGTLAAGAPLSARGSRLVALVGALDRTQRAGLADERFVTTADLGLVRSKVSRSKRAQVVLVDSGDPGFADTFLSVVADLADVPHDDLTLSVLTGSNRTRDLLARSQTSFEIRAVDPADLAARHLIQQRAPHEDLELTDGRLVDGYRALVIAEGGALQERLVEHLVMNSQFLGPLPELTIVTPRPARGTFEVRHPEAHLSCALTWIDLDLDSSEFYRLLGGRAFAQVVVALADESRGSEVGHAVETYCRRHRADGSVPRILVHASASETATDSCTFFGGRNVIFSDTWWVEEAQDRDALRVNGYYQGIDRRAADAVVQERAAWRGLSYVNRASSRASAEFTPGLLEVARSAAQLGEPEQLELVAQTEHLRWNAFYRMLGYQRLPSDELRPRFEDARARHPQGAPDEWARCARDDEERLRHVCLVEWDELPQIDAVHAELDGVRPRDFQQTDRDVIALVDLLGPSSRSAAPVEPSAGQPHPSTAPGDRTPGGP